MSNGETQIQRSEDAPNFYDRRQQAKAERIDDRVEQLTLEEAERYERAGQYMAGWPLGQPLVNNSARTAHRKMIKAQDAAANVTKNRQQAQQRQKSIGNGGIASDDPTAVQQIKAKIEYLEEEADQKKAINKALRKRPGTKKGLRVDAETWDVKAETDHLAAAANLTQHEAIQLVAPEHRTNRVGVPSWEVTNMRANIRRLKKRLVELETLTLEDDDFARTGTFSDNTEWECTLEEGRYRIRSTKPDRTVTRQLRSLGWNWSRNEAAWQKKVTPNAQNSIDHVLTQLGAKQS